MRKSVGAAVGVAAAGALVLGGMAWHASIVEGAARVSDIDDPEGHSRVLGTGADRDLLRSAPHRYEDGSYLFGQTNTPMASHDPVDGSLHELDRSWMLDEDGEAMNYGLAVGAADLPWIMWSGDRVIGFTIDGTPAWRLEATDLGLGHLRPVAVLDDGAVAVHGCDPGEQDDDAGETPCEITLVGPDGGQRWTTGGGRAGRVLGTGLSLAELPPYVVDYDWDGTSFTATVLNPESGSAVETSAGDAVVAAGAWTVLVDIDELSDTCHLTAIDGGGPTPLDLTVPCEAASLDGANFSVMNRLSVRGPYLGLDDLADLPVSSLRYVVHLPSGAIDELDDDPAASESRWLTPAGLIDVSGDGRSLTAFDGQAGWVTHDLGATGGSVDTAVGTVLITEPVATWNPLVDGGTRRIRVIDPSTGAECARAVVTPDDGMGLESAAVADCRAVLALDGEVVEVG